MSLLSGKAIDWAAAVWETERLFRTSYKYFVQQLRDVFEYPAGGKDISTQLLHMSQGNRTAADYAIEFRTLAAQSGWNDISLKAVFRQSLNFDLQTELACKGENSLFTEYITLTIKIDNLMRNAPKKKLSSHHRPALQSHTSSAMFLNLQCPPLILAPLINMSKGGCENKSALFILLIFHSKNSQNSNLSLK